MVQSEKYRRILLKLSGEVLQGNKNGGIDFAVLEDLCKQIAEVKKMGTEIAVVVGGGNIWRYRDFKDSPLERVHSDFMGMLATVMNALAFKDQFQKLKVASQVLSAVSMPSVVENYSQSLAKNYLESGNIVLCAGGTGNPYFTTDSAAALRALELNCDVLLKATKVDFVYDKDPIRFKDAQKFTQLSYQEVLKRQLAVMDLAAIALCLEKNLPILVFNLHKKGAIARVVKGDNIGTLIS